MHLAEGLVFAVSHVALRGLTSYASWGSQVRDWVSGIGTSQAHAFQIRWPILETLFVSSAADDFMFVYVPIVLIAHAVWYYQSFRERDLRTSQLEAQLAKARLQALKSQMQPHFLFNTLHSISALMLTDTIAADQMMSRLSDLLRMSLEGDGSQITTLSRELEFVNGYLEIEKLRFEDRIRVVLDIAPNTLDAQVPNLLLQPLVENAVRHGVSRLPSGGEIRITASHSERSLRLQIKDNGPGLVGSAGVQSKGGLGLGSTRERLRTLYGDDQELDIRNAAGGGVEVNVRIPFLADPHLSVDEVVPYTTRTS
jgi:LytS/YehU family sensor histidine kinase